MSSKAYEKKQAAKDVIDIIEEIALLLNCNLTRHQLSLCVSLIENGVNPEALADVIKDIRTQYPASSSSAIDGGDHD